MGSLVDYDKHYQLGPGQCGEPFAELVAFFESTSRRLAVLDLGCGQGRDATLAATHGHRVLGVDLSLVGLEQLRAEAKAKSFDIEVAHSDITSFRSRRRFDVVILDRVLHLLLTDQERELALANAVRLSRKNATILVVDGAKHAPLIHTFFDAQEDWVPFKKSKRMLFAARGAG